MNSTSSSKTFQEEKAGFMVNIIHLTNKLNEKWENCLS